ANLIADKQIHGDPSERPVFIIGMPRAGTTLCEQIIASHREADGVGELDEIKNLASQLAPQPYPAQVGQLGKNDIGNLAAKYLRRIDSLADRAALRVADKWPTNFLHLGLIAILFPNARIIHCERDPMDTCLSIYAENFSGVAYSNDLEHIGAFYRQCRRLMAHWSNVLPTPVFNLSYEDMVENQEASTRDLLDFCGLAWDPACLEFHTTKRTVKTTSMQQVRQPIYSRSIGRWKNYERHLGPLRNALELD
ncbi:MAG: sulfotransferase family protein, partial [Aestuariivirgaceae bacterium]